MYKMLVLDMDGTLLDSNKKITKQNKLAIKYAIDLGTKVVISTGRSLLGVTNYLKELDLIHEDEYTISCAGAIIVNNTNSNILHGSFLSSEDIKSIYSIANNLRLNLNAYTTNSLLIQEEGYYNSLDSYVNSFDEISVDFSNVMQQDVAKITLFKEDEKVINYFKEHFPNVNLPIKHTNYNKPSLIDSFSNSDNFLKDLHSKFNVMKTTPYTLEITRKGTSKGSAVKLLSDRLNIKREEIICIGDSGNDKQMIEYAGLGVAMGNAYDEIKNIADYVTLTNDESGVAHVVNKFILDNIA